MSGFGSFAAALCVACIFIGAVQLICPDGAMQKSVKYIISLVFLVTIISSAGLINKNVDLDFSFAEAEGINAEELRAKTCEYAYSEALKNASIKFKKITVCTDKLKNGSIVISKVIIYTDCEKDYLLKALGITSNTAEVEVVDE